MKEVSHSSQKKSHKNRDLLVLNQLKAGFRPSQICSNFGINKKTLQHTLSSLKAQGIIKKVGYGTWEIDAIKEVSLSTKDTPPQPESLRLLFEQKKEVRGHAFIWKVRIPSKFKRIDWRALFQAQGIKFAEMGKLRTPRVMIDGRKIWFGQKNIIIFEPTSFFGRNSIESRKFAVFKFIDIMNKIEQLTKLDLKPYKFTPRREHFALIQNSLAIQCHKDGTKIYVRNDDEFWFVIDNSFNLHEAETIGKDSMQDNLGVQRYFNEHKETNFQVTPKFVLNGLSELTKNQQSQATNIQEFAVALNQHIPAYTGMKDEVAKLNKAIDLLAKKIEEKDL